MNQEIVNLINNISKNIYESLNELNNSTINQLNDLIQKEKEKTKREALIAEKNQLYDNFIDKIDNYLKSNLSEQQMKDILSAFLAQDSELLKEYNRKYRSWSKEEDVLYYFLHGLCSSITDKDFVSNLVEESVGSYSLDKFIDVSPDFFDMRFTYYKPLLLLSYCNNKDMVDEYAKARIYSESNMNSSHSYKYEFLSNYSETEVYNEDLIIEYSKDFFDNHKGDSQLNTQSWNYFVDILQDIPLETKKKIIDLYTSYFPEYYDEVIRYGLKLLVDNYESAISTIIDNDLRGSDLKPILYDTVLSSEDLIKLYNDERLIERLSKSHVYINESTDSETKYNILFHTLLTKHVINNQIMKSTILLYISDYDLIYGLLTHEDSLSYILQDENFINEFLAGYVRNLNDSKTNAKVLEIFKNYLTPEQLNLFFMPDKMPPEVHLEYYLDDQFSYKIFNVFHPVYNPNGDKDKIQNIKEVQQLIERLFKDNKYLFKTFNPNFINDDFLKFDYSFISLISKYSYLQSTIVDKVNGNNTSLANVGHDSPWIVSLKKNPQRFADFVLKHANGKDHATSKPIDSKICGKAFTNMLNVINSIDSECTTKYIDYLCKISECSHYRLDVFGDFTLFDEATLFEKFVFNVCQGLDISTITPDQWKTLTKIFMHDLNTSVTNKYIRVDINSLQDIDTYDERRREKLDNLFTNAINDKDIEQAINIFLNKYYDMDINRAREIIEVYGSDLDSLKDEKYNNSINFIRKIKKVLSVVNIEQLNKMYQEEKELSFEETIIFRNNLERIFSNSLSSSLTSFESMKQLNNEELAFPSNIKVYEVPDEFMMLVNSTQAYGTMELLEDNYKTSWNESDRTTNHGICCSLIANDFLGTADINDVLLGFNDLSEFSLVKSAPYDLFTRNDQANIDSLRKALFFLPRDIINNTRLVYNEQDIERREFRQQLLDQGVLNLQPSYVVVFSDMSEKLRNKAFKCAEDFGIPIVYVDKKKIVEKESSIIDKMIDELNNTQDISKQIDMFSEIYLKHENNRNGLKSQEELQKIFSTARIEKVLNDIIDRLIIEKNNTQDYKKYCEDTLKLVDILQKEEDKYTRCFELGFTFSVNDININKYIEKLYKEMSEEIFKVNTSKLSDVASLIPSNDTVLSKEFKEIDTKEIESEIRSLNNTEFYHSESKNHNLEHSERVTVLAMLIGKKELSNDKHSQYLLRLSAELHDSGRQKDNRDINHAEKGAQNAKTALQDKIQEGILNQRDLSIIQFAIEYHEFEHFRRDNEEYLKKLARKYAIDENDFDIARKIAECLKDADALDRVRFHNEDARLDEGMLITPSARDLIETAKQLFEEYKNYDKNQFIKNTNIKCKEREENHKSFKQSEIRYKMKSKFEKLVAQLKRITNKEKSKEGDLNEIRRGQ